MSENFESVIDQDWSEIAIDDGTYLSENQSYLARLFPREGLGDPPDPLESKVENISFNPKANSANSLKIDVEPDPLLEEDVFMAGIIDVFVGGEPIFSGEIQKISTHQNEDGFYTVESRGPGKKLSDQNIDETVEDYILADYIAKTVDKYNDYHAEHFDLVNTTDETLNNITEVDNRTRQADSDGATAEYSISENAEDIEAIYVKAKTEAFFHSITVSISEGSYSEDITDIYEYSFGEWVRLTPDSSDLSSSSSYNITFTMDENSILYDWIILEEQRVQREADPQEVEFLDDEEQVQYADDDQSFNDLLDSHIEDTDPFRVENDRLEQQQNAHVIDSESISTNRQVGSEYSSGRGVYLGGENPEGVWFEFYFTPNYDIENLDIWVRTEFIPEDSDDDDIVLPEISIGIEGSSTAEFGDGSTIPNNDSDYVNLGWKNWGDMGFIAPDTYTEGETHTVRFEVTQADVDFSERPEDGYGRWLLDVVAFTDNRFNYSFDNEVHEPGGYLDGPESFCMDPENHPEIELPEFVSPDIIDSASIETSLSNPNSTDLALSFDGGDTYQSTTGTSSFTADNDLATSTVNVRIGGRGYSSFGPRDQTPRLGYNSTKVYTYELLIGTGSLEILHDKEISGSRLKVISDLAEDSNHVFRWEGNKCKIFRSGSIENDIDLLKEDVKSSRDISDTYSACIVNGTDGVSSGVIESSEAPPYIDREKEINDPGIKTEQDAIRKANAYLAKNGDVKYTGEAVTLPTLAPVGELVSGENFNHGQDMYIESVRYSKNRSTIKFGKEKNINEEFIKLDRDNFSTNARGTRSSS